MFVFLYKEVIGLLDFSKGTMIGLFLLVLAIISFLFGNFSKDYSSGEFEGNDYKIYLRECKSEDIIEIDTFNELKAIDKTYDV